MKPYLKEEYAFKLALTVSTKMEMTAKLAQIIALNVLISLHAPTALKVTSSTQSTCARIYVEMAEEMLESSVMIKTKEMETDAQQLVQLRMATTVGLKIIELIKRIYAFAILNLFQQSGKTIGERFL